MVCGNDVRPDLAVELRQNVVYRDAPLRKRLAQIALKLRSGWWMSHWQGRQREMPLDQSFDERVSEATHLIDRQIKKRQRINSIVHSNAREDFGIIDNAKFSLSY
jgi:hypothetical protein